MVVRNVIMVSECDVMNDTEIKGSHFLCFFCSFSQCFYSFFKTIVSVTGFLFHLLKRYVKLVA